MSSKEVAVTEGKLKEIGGIGPKSAKSIVESMEEKGIMNFRQLKEAIDNNRLQRIKGIGPSTQQDIDQYLNNNSDRLLPKEEAKEVLRRDQPWKLVKFQVWLGAMTLALILAGTIPRSYFISPISNGILGASLLPLGIWARRVWKQVGTDKIPAQGVLTWFFDPIDVVGIGRYFILWPIERIKQFPTGEYEMHFEVPEVYTKENKKKEENGEVEASQRMRVKVTLYASFPDRNKIYSYPMPKTEAKERGIHFDPVEGDYTNREGWVWGKVPGKELLMGAYRKIRISDLTAEGTVHKLGDFLSGGVAGAIRGVFQSHTTKQINEKTDLIEEEVKKYLLVEEGNPMYETGIPRENIDVEITLGELDDDTVQAKKEVEIAFHNKQAAEYEIQVTKKRIQALIDVGAPPKLALIIEGVKSGGESLDFSEYRDLVFFEKLGGFEPFSGLGDKEKFEKLKDMSAKERDKFIGEMLS